jgi:hypothetical protein
MKNDHDARAISGLVTGVSFVAAIVGAMRLAKDPFPRPGAPVDEVRRYYSDSIVAARFSVVGQAVSILSLATFTSSVSRLAGRSDRAPRALRVAAIASGTAAAASLATAAATHASLTGPRERDDRTTAAMARRVFVAGGPVHGVFYGVFTGVLAIAAQRAGLLRRPGVVTGVVSAAAGVLSPLYFKWENAGWLIPIGRFSGYVLGGIVGVRLARKPD